MSNITEADYTQLLRNQAARAAGEPGPCPTCGHAPDAEPPRKRSKYNAKAVRFGVLRFDSAREFDQWAELERALQAGEVAWYGRQLRFCLDPAGQSEYVCDFVAAYPDGRVDVVDVKGGEATKTPTYRLKKRLLESRMRVEVREL